MSHLKVPMYLWMEHHQEEYCFAFETDVHSQIVGIKNDFNKRHQRLKPETKTRNQTRRCFYDCFHYEFGYGLRAERLTRHETFVMVLITVWTIDWLRALASSCWF
jgi:hypothetical protein